MNDSFLNEIDVPKELKRYIKICSEGSLKYFTSSHFKGVYDKCLIDRDVLYIQLILAEQKYKRATLLYLAKVTKHIEVLTMLLEMDDSEISYVILGRTDLPKGEYLTILFYNYDSELANSARLKYNLMLI